MSVETWGEMPKAQDNSQKIDEAISVAISAHNDDPDAHLGAGQALDSHRAAEVIDHLAYSIVSDKLNDSLFQNKLFLTSFSTVDIFAHQESSHTLEINGIIFWTSTVLNNIAYYALRSVLEPVSSFLQNPVLVVPFSLSCTNSYLAYVGIGDLSITYDNSFAGFKFYGGHVYARTYSETTSHETLVDLGAFNQYQTYILRIEVTQGSNVKFYIDESLVATITTDIPDVNETFPLIVYIKTTHSGTACYATFRAFTYQQNP